MSTLGKHWKRSKEANRKQSESMKLHYKNGAIHPKGMLGKKHTKETMDVLRDVQKGEKNGRWQGGITKLQLQIRNSFEYRQWRSDVFTRDNFTCQECGQVGEKLNADHLTPFSVILFKNGITSKEEALACEELWSMNNGRTLCEDCHKETDTYASKAIKYKKAVLSPLQLTT